MKDKEDKPEGDQSVAPDIETGIVADEDVAQEIDEKGEPPGGANFA